MLVAVLSRAINLHANLRSYYKSLLDKAVFSEVGIGVLGIYSIDCHKQNHHNIYIRACLTQSWRWMTIFPGQNHVILHQPHFLHIYIPSVNYIYIYGMMHTIVNQVNYEKGRNIYPNTAIPPLVKTPFLPTKKPPVPFHLKRRYLKCI